MGRYCSYILPKQGDGTSQIEVNPTLVRKEKRHLVEPKESFAEVTARVRAGGRWRSRSYFLEYGK